MGGQVSVGTACRVALRAQMAMIGVLSVTALRRVVGLTLLRALPYRWVSVSATSFACPWPPHLGWFCLRLVLSEVGIHGLADCGRRSPRPANLLIANLRRSREQAHLPAQQPSPRQDARVPPAHADPCGPGHPGRAAPQGPRRALGLSPTCCRRVTVCAPARTSRRRCVDLVPAEQAGG